MAEGTLVEADVEGGRELLEALDRASIPVTSAFWLFNDESRLWRLVLSSPVVDTDGPFAFFKRVQSVLMGLSNSRVTTSDLMALPPNHGMVDALRRLINTGPTIDAVRMSNSIVNGTVISDLLVYRSS